MAITEKPVYLYTSIKKDGPHAHHGLFYAGREKIIMRKDGITKVGVEGSGYWKSEDGFDRSYDGCKPVCLGHTVLKVWYELKPGKKILDKRTEVMLHIRYITPKGKRVLVIPHVKRTRLESSFLDVPDLLND